MSLKRIYLFIAAITLFSACATTQSIIKSTFPYTADLTVSASVKPGAQAEALSDASSFDQNFSRDGDNAYMINTVRVTSARLRSINPISFNLGNLTDVKIYMAKQDGSNEILVASRSDITSTNGNNLVLDVDNTQVLDKLVRQRHVRIRMVYKLRNNLSVDAGMRLTLGLSAKPNKN